MGLRRVPGTVFGCVVLLGACGGSSGTTASPDTHGPMRAPVEHGSLAKGTVGTRFTDGFEVLQLQGDAPATIVSVRSVSGEHAMRFLGAKIAGPTRKYAAWSRLPGYPPSEKALGPLTDAEGASIRARDQTQQRMGYELLLGYEIVADDQIAARTEVQVTYQVGDRTYLWTSPAALVYCPEDEDPDICMKAGGG